MNSFVKTAEKGTGGGAEFVGHVYGNPSLYTSGMSHEARGAIYWDGRERGDGTAMKKGSKEGASDLVKPPSYKMQGGRYYVVLSEDAIQ